MSNLKFTNQDLRNRSFKGQNLTGADFSNCNIQGCDFSSTILVEANFEKVKAGRTTKQLINFTFINGSLLTLLMFDSSDFAFSWQKALIEHSYNKVEIVALSISSIIWFLIIGYISIKFIDSFKKSATGTYFNKANLTNSKFTDAVLKGTDFSDAILTYVDWNRANLGTNISEAKFSIDPKIIRLCASRNGKNKDYCDMDLSNLNLVGVDLTNANLGGADLSRSLLHKANLQYSNLSEAQAIATDFYKATLTGVCIKNWGISPDTNFTDVQCDYVYLELDHKERRPHNGSFKTGEFNDVFQKTFETIDLIFRNGIDWDAFAYSFKKVEVENQGAQLDVQSIEKKGDGVILVRVAVAPDADKAKIESEFMQGYEFAVKALEAQYQGRLEDKEKIINQLFSTINQQNKLLAQTGDKVSIYYQPNSQFAGGIVDATSVDAQQIGGNIQNNDTEDFPR
ncbi:pentapeptide repeat-containing protein [Dendronalium sp. ChiSLP03b]|uniref:pentapeptide repeat-containing protein n=1 Tax=Dendronalium sp. ChiSLP03b TaxID=3075381 RepID=UPI002AD53967|nr:pentapeptide repeat-containing protein [Dendronalium sp. ChiSLP03b]MDZ8203427.1 pentapeptide repeat-containing protein [Dendronalium sp. ChiSLP03b]